MTKLRRRELAESAFNRLIQALKITKDFSSPCPPLEAAVGALLVALEAYKRYSEALEALDTLLTRIEPLQSVLRKALEVDYDKCPKALKERLEVFASKLLSVADDAKALRSRRRLARFINASDYAEQTEAWVKKLSWYIQSFILEGTIALELTVHEGFTRMEGRFDKLDEGISEANKGISGLREDFDHKLTDDPLRIRLRPVLEARFDHGSSVHVECHEGTRGEVLATLCSWLRPDDPRLATLPEPAAPADCGRRLLWIHALPGVGKSTIARTAAVFWDKDKVLGATFFCARDGQRSDILAIFRTLAYQLARRYPKFHDALLKILDDDPDLYAASPARQLEKLIAEPIQVAVKQGAFHGRVPVIIDALDECTDKAAVSTILTSLALHISKLEPLCVLITSRREENITRGFLAQALVDNTQTLGATIPISTFHLTGQLHFGLLGCSDEKARDPEGRLDGLLESGNAAVGSGTETTSLLDRLYEQILADAVEKLGEVLKGSLPRMLLGTLVLAEERLSPSTLATILDLPPRVVERSLPAFHAVTTVPAANDATSPIRLIHLSFTNFLVDPTRCTDKRFLVHPPTHHSLIALRCLKLMQESLKHNICEVPPVHDHLLNHNIPDLPARITRYLPPTLQYACRYWVRHLSLADIGEEVLAALEEFCETRLLHWVETLSLLGCVDIAVKALRSTQLSLKSLALRELRRDVLAVLYECERMVQAFYPAISASFMQVYRTAIPFSPADSLLRRSHQADASQAIEVRKGLEETWSTTLTSRVTGTSTIIALAFSPDGACVACGAKDHSVRLLNTHTGAHLQSFEGHTGWIRSVSFSPTGKEILSGSDDRTVRLWDVATGACLDTWTEHSDWVLSVTWSPGGTFIASTDGHGIVMLREIAESPQKSVALPRHAYWVRSVTFASDGSLLSGSDDDTCRIWDTTQFDWDAANHAPSQILEHSSGVMAVAVSPDSCLVACGLKNGEVVLWRKSDGHQLCSLAGESEVISLVFYSDSRLAAAYENSPFILWDISTATPLDSLSNMIVDSAAFSPDGVHIAHAVGSTLHTQRWSGNAPLEPRPPSLVMRLRQRFEQRFDSHLPLLRSARPKEEIQNHLLNPVVAVAVSPTGTLILAVHQDHWRLWDVSTGQCMGTQKCPASGLITPTVAWSPSGSLFACTDEDKAIRVWEAKTGNHLGTFAGHSWNVTAVVFTADEQHILSTSEDGSIRRWNVRKSLSEPASEVLFQSAGDVIDDFALSSDEHWMLCSARRRDSPPGTSNAYLLAKSSRQPVAYGGQDWYCALRLHDATGHVVWIENHPSPIESVAFSDDCTRALVGTCEEGAVFVYDLTQLFSASAEKAPSCPPPSPTVLEHQLSSGCVVEALKITKDLSSACPQLQLAVGALLAVLETYKRYTGTSESISSLLSRVETLNHALKTLLSSGYEDCPDALKRRLDNLVEALESVASSARNLKARGRFVRFVNAFDDVEKVQAWMETLSWHIQSFLVEGAIALELTVHGMDVDMQNGFRVLGGRLGVVHNEVNEMRDQIPEHGTDNSIPGLRYASHARFDFGRSGRSECDDNTRQEVLRAIYSWLRPECRDLEDICELLPSIELVPDSSILWIHGLAGAGKTTLAATIGKWCHDHGRLGSSFFCARDGDRSDIQCIVQNIASDVAERCPKFRKALLTAVKDHPHIRTASVSQQVQVLLTGPVQAVTRNGKATSLEGLVVIIDALDECKDESAESTFLQALSLHIKDLDPLIFIITSRPIPNIARGFRFLEVLRKRMQEFPLDALPSGLTARDITAFVRRRFADISRRYASAGSDWVSEDEVQRVAKLSEGLFIYAATLSSFVEDPNVADPRAQLDIFCRSVRSHPTKAATGTSTETRLEVLDALYEQVLHSAFKNPSASLQARFKRILGTIVVAEERFSLSGLSAILGEEPGSVLDIVERLRSILSFSAEGDIHSVIRIIHISFADFLVDPDRCKHTHFLVNPSLQHAFMALRCLKLMQGALRYNICEVPSAHTHMLNHEIPGLPDRIARHLPPALQYACRYWLRHLLGLADVGEELLAALESFCNTHLLHWLETLSLLGCVEIAVESLHSVQLFWKTLSQREIRRSDVSALLYECERMSRAFYPAISASFMQVYRTAIPFSPVNSVLCRHYQADVLQAVEVRKGLEETWSITLTSRVIGTDTISALAFSPDGAHVVCGAGDGSVRLLNANTGAQLQKFEGHTTWIGQVAFSPTGMEVMTGSADGTVRVWDVAVGACLHTWSDHSGGVGSVAWSPNGLFLASGAYDRTTILREVASPGKRAVLGHRDLVSDITFATDGSLVSGSFDRTCKIWDTVQIDWNTANRLPSRTMEHSSSVMRVVVSPDSCLIACGLDNGEVVLWRKSDGQRLRSLPGESDVISIAFNSDSRLASAYRYSPFILWDISTATPLDTLDNARASVAVFCPDGVHSVHAISNTIYIRRWSGNAPLKPERPSLSMRFKRWFDPHVPLRRYVHNMAEVEPDSDPLTHHLAAVSVSPTGTLVLTVYEDHWQLWDVSDGNWVRHKKCAMAGSVLSITAWSPRGNRFACTTVHNGVGVWETLTGNHLGTFSEHSRHVTAIAFTADEQHILTASRDGSIRRWTFWPTSSSEILFQSAEDTIDALAVSPDGQWLVSGASRRDSPPDTSSAELLVKPSRQTVEYWGEYCVLRLHDATGRVIWIENHPSWIRSAKFSDDCMRILVGNSEGEVFLYDLTPLVPANKVASGAPPPLAILEHKFSPDSASPVFHVSFAPDGQGIITERNYIPLPSALQLEPLSVRAAYPSLSLAYFLDDDGWMWCSGLKQSLCRVCWVPPSFRPHPFDFARLWRSLLGHGVVWRTLDSRLVTIDTSQC
ncbi:hypothetical protein ACG7TL_007424 [Trametes sanguinea]